MTTPSTSDIQIQVQQALNEDLGSDTNCEFMSQDVTASLISENKKSKAQLICREKAILCGQQWFNTAFNLLDKDIEIKWYFEDGQEINDNDVVCEVAGNARHILTAERTALNFLQTLSASATQTHSYVKAINKTNCKILDTRKTIPGLRLAQKYAVTCGGGVNHRVGLYDMVLIKENHIHATGSISTAVNKARENFKGLKIEVEAENLDELQQAIECNVDRILLDNMDITTLKKAVELTNKRIDLEASGNITLETICSIAETGVDYISTGAITKNIMAIDFSLRFIEEN
ncbi:MAG: carboxylating nicotinate-nucleotide diphosphorylase [Gammaproteobacteria bacterium]|nr:carboxylating nicotinate-nucleotide diphosphorylase [Gammaproteobacteria bacterium]